MDRHCFLSFIRVPLIGQKNALAIEIVSHSETV
jgi:Holliday junction resolvasome RuvABC DNA-binding subunit